MIPLANLSSLSRFLLVAGLTAPLCAQQLRSTLVASGLNQPIGGTAPIGDTHRLFVSERTGTIRIIRDGVLLPTPFLDIRPEVSMNGEGGMLGLAFHPSYAVNGRFFVSFTGGIQVDPIVREYRVSVNPDLADPASGVDVLAGFPYYTSYEWHYGGDLHFGPDGMLYVSLGDNGDELLAQQLLHYNGKILRMNVDLPPPHVPVDNPYADPNDQGLDLMWARGLRNPWRFSFDRLTGDLYIGDVGESTREEVNFQPRSFGSPGSPGYQGGGNFGWPCMEGSACTGNNLQCVCDTAGATLDLPVYETSYPTQGLVMIGGFVYRGSAIPGLQGQYFCADWLKETITSFAVLNGHATNILDRSVELGIGLPGGVRSVASFGEDANGEIYLISHGPGEVYRIDPAVPSCTPPVAYCVTAPNSAGSGAVMDSMGSASISNSEFVLLSRQAAPRVVCAFLCGTQEVQVPFGNGWSCVGGTVVWQPILRTNLLGEAIQPLNYSLISVSPGQTRDFQLLYRDPSAGGARFNLSNGLRVVFCP